MAEVVPCPYCNAKFATPTDLATHLTSVHAKPAPDFAEKLKEALEKAKEKRSRFPPTWNWGSDGDTFVGRIRSIREINFQDRTSRAFECIMPDGSTRTLWDSPKVLKRLLEEEKPKVGDVIAVKNLGKPKGKRYLDFLLVVNPEGVSIQAEGEEAKN